MRQYLELRKHYRAQLLDKQDFLNRVHCQECPTSKSSIDHTVKCDGCGIYERFKGIGKQLLEV